MKSSTPTLQQVNPLVNSSFTIRSFPHPGQNFSKEWHYHQVLEIIYINQGSGKKYIGNNFSYFSSGDLFVIGPLVPHYSFIDPEKPGQVKYSIQMTEGFPGVSLLMMPELLPIKKLLEKAAFGISFYGKTKTNVGKKIETLEQYSPIEQFIRMLDILKGLALSEEYKVLNPSAFVIDAIPKDFQRLQGIFNFVRENFRRPITLLEAADLAHLVPPSFARYFKKVTGRTFTHFVNEYRLLHASKLLAETEKSITDVCFESGFNNFSHFNKQFKEYAGKSPSVYRAEILDGNMKIKNV